MNHQVIANRNEQFNFILFHVHAKAIVCKNIGVGYVIAVNLQFNISRAKDVDGFGFSLSLPFTFLPEHHQPHWPHFCRMSHRLYVLYRFLAFVPVVVELEHW